MRRELSQFERTLRSNVRGFLMTATREEMVKELKIDEERGDKLRAEFVREVIAEYDAGNW